jgi:hypothetical protein
MFVNTVPSMWPAASGAILASCKEPNGKHELQRV